MSAIADFTVAVLDCQACCRHFIESRIVLARHADRVACPHCGTRYGAASKSDADATDLAREAAGRARRPRGVLHALGLRRPKRH